jgi:5-methylcytosine-specific restriction enzyme subunit McrC
MQFLELQEEKDAYFSKETLSEEAALQLHNSKKFEVEFPSPANLGKYRLRSKGWIGHVPLKGNACVRIIPKVPVGNVFKMLEQAFNLKSFHLFDGLVQVTRMEEVFERLASILAKRILERIRRGLYRDYVLEGTEVAAVRGRLLVEETLACFHRNAKFRCEFHDYTADLEDNQILLWTLNLLPRFGFQRETVKRQIRQARMALLNTVTLEEHAATDCINRFYHRLNYDYRPLHGLCRFFLENCGPGLEAGIWDFIPFLVNMPLLFESYVAEWLKANLPGGLHLQSHYEAELDANANLRFVIDLVVENSDKDRVAVLDTKHKQPRPTESDIQQAAAYALRMGTSRAFLVYPTSEAKPLTIKLGHVTVKTCAFDVSQDPDTGGRTFLSWLLKEIRA